MDKHTKFNQWLLSIIGIGFILIPGFYFLQEISRSFRGSSNDHSGVIVSPEQAQKLVADSIRKQVVSLKKLVLLDSAKQEFLIPVGQAQLEKEKDNSLDLRSGSFRKSYKFQDDGGSNLNNLLYWEGLTGKTKPLFDKRLGISRFEYFGGSIGRPVLAFFTDADTNKDKILDKNDLGKLAVWMPSWERPKVLDAPGRAPLDIPYFVKNYIVITFGEDRDRDGRFEHGHEPVQFYRLNLNCPDPQCVDLHQVVGDSAIARLQRTLDGL